MGLITNVMSVSLQLSYGINESPFFESQEQLLKLEKVVYNTLYALRVF